MDVTAAAETSMEEGKGLDPELDLTDDLVAAALAVVAAALAVAAAGR